MTRERLQETVQACALREGFSAAGVAPVSSVGSADEYLERWIAEGRAGEMNYLKRRAEDGRLVRSSLAVALPWARSVIICAASYEADAPHSLDPAPRNAGWIARYAWSGSRVDGQLRPSDYHKVLLGKLKRVEAALHQSLRPSDHASERASEPEDFTSRAWVDTGPVIERSYAHAAGIGWTGKNTCTLSESLGSFFFLGIIATSLVIEEPQRALLPPDRCGSCTRCIDACPTQALPAPYQMDASRCIAYLTIEKRGIIAAELRSGMGRQVFRCDICQDVCPWNNKPSRAGLASVAPELQPRPELINPDLGALAALSEEDYVQLFHGSPVKRAKFEGLRRNVAIAMGNSGCLDFLPQLARWREEADPVLAEAAEWAIARLRGT